MIFTAVSTVVILCTTWIFTAVSYRCYTVHMNFYCCLIPLLYCTQHEFLLLSHTVVILYTTWIFTAVSYRCYTVHNMNFYCCLISFTLVDTPPPLFLHKATDIPYPSLSLSYRQELSPSVPNSVAMLFFLRNAADIPYGLTQWLAPIHTPTPFVLQSNELVQSPTVWLSCHSPLSYFLCLQNSHCLPSSAKEDNHKFIQKM